MTSGQVFNDFIAIGVTVLALVYIRRSRRLRLPYPPGPHPLPIFGNLFDIPKESGHIVYADMSRRYNSDVIHLDTFGTHLVILNTVEAAIELLVRRSAINSDRPTTMMMHNLLDFGNWGVAFIPYGPRLKDSRRLAQSKLNATATKDYRPVESAAARELLKRLVQNPESFMQDIRHMAGKIILRITYGFDIKPDNDPYVGIAERALYATARVVNPGSYLVDSVPILRFIPEWLPGGGFKKDVKEWQVHFDDMRDKPFELVKKARSRQPVDYQVSSDSIAATFLDKMDKSTADPEYMEDIIKSALGSFYAAGADTTVSSLGTFVLAMLLYPDVQKKAQAQIDQIVGDRLPEFEDRQFLPYIDAIVSETLRWHPVIPQNVPHLAEQDNIYKGYYIPKGSVLVANHWAMLNDPETYPAPTTFNPERFLDEHGRINTDVPDPSSIAFGFGRRICPGRFMVKESMWITIASILSTFNIVPKVGADGQPIIPHEEFTDGLLSHPKPFTCNIQARSREHEALIYSAAV
ncbi:cytochrome P450 family protein [Abortiporus biennis]